MKKSILLFTFILFLCKITLFAQQSYEKEITGLNWSYGDLGAEEHWMPTWLPLIQTGFRWKAGIRLSGGSIALSCPVKVRMEYNQSNATGGNQMLFKVKAMPQSSSQNTFDSGFGFSFPNKTQVGIIGVPGLDNLLPWFDTGIDLWDLFSIVPTVGSPVSSAVSNVGVNMRSTEALPLGSSKEFHDTRTLFSFDLTDLIQTDAKKANAVTRLYNKLGPSAQSKILTAIKIVKRCNDAEALDIFKGILGTAIEKVASLGSIGIKGDPYFKIEGAKIVMVVNFYVGNRTSGTTVVTLTNPSQYGEFYVSIPPFVKSGEQLTIKIDEIYYEFKLSQTLNSQLAVPAIGDIDMVDYTKVVTYSQAVKKLNSSDYSFSVPLQPSTLPIPEYIANPGAVSAIYTYVSPTIPLKGALVVKKGSQTVKTLSEQNFKNTHGLIVTGLTPSTNYTFQLTCYDAAGNPYPVPDVTKTTKESVSTRILKEVESGNTIKNLNATAGIDKFTVTWNTDRTSSTEIFFSPSSQEYLTKYLSGVKKSDNSVNVGWADATDVPRKLETNHSITITDLEPGTKYYYRVSSRYYQNNNINNTYEYYVDKIGEITTGTFPSVKVKAVDGSSTVANLAVELYKTTDPTHPMILTTESNGITPPFVLEAGASYKARLQNHPGFANVTSSQITVPGTAQNELSTINLSLTRKPSSGGKVVDSNGNGISGATVKISGSSQQTTSDSQGNYNFNNLNLTGDKQIIVTKTGYFESRGPGNFNEWGLFSAVPVVMNSNQTNLQITLKSGSSPVAGASVKLKNPSGTVLKSENTNSSGVVNIQHTFTSVPAPAVYSVEITPASGSKVMPSVEYIGLEPGLNANYTFQCVSDNTPPQISNISFQQVNGNINAGFASSELGKYMTEITYPSNQTVAGPWTDFGTNITEVSNKTIVTNAVSGTYKIRVKVRDNYGNETASPFTDVVIFNASTIQLNTGNITTNSAELQWTKYPESNFGKYIIYKATSASATTGTKVTEISSVATTKFTLNNLASNSQFFYLLKIYDNSGTIIGSDQNPIKVSFSTTSTPPVISGSKITPTNVSVNEAVKITASISDKDSKITSVIVVVQDSKTKSEILNVNPGATNYALNVTYTPRETGDFKVLISASDETKETFEELPFTVSELQTERPVIKFDGVASSVAVKGSFEGNVLITNPDAVKDAKISCSVSFGDGEKASFNFSGDQEKPVIPFKHIYTKSGSFKIEAELICTTEKGQINSEVISKTITVSSKSGTVALTVDTSAGKKNTQKIKAAVTAGSFEIEKWELNFADGESEKGSGELEKEFTHTFNKKGYYGVQLLATESGGKQLKKTVGVTIAADLEGESKSSETKPPESKATTQTSTSKTTSATKSSDSATTKAQDSPGADVEIQDVVLPESGKVNSAVSIEINVKNNSTVVVPKATVKVEGPDNFNVKRVLYLKAGQAMKTKFSWFPKKEGDFELKISVEAENDTQEANNSKTFKIKINK